MTHPVLASSVQPALNQRCASLGRSAENLRVVLTTLVPVTIDGPERDARVETLADGTFVKFWIEGRAVNVQRLNTSGQPVGEVSRPFGSGDIWSSPYNPDVMALPDGGFLVTTSMNSRFGYSPSFAALRFDSGGERVGRSLGGFGELSGLELLPSGDIVLASLFIDSTWNPPGEPPTARLSVQLFNSQGMPKGAAHVLDQGPEMYFRFLAVTDITPLDDGGYMVSWSRGGLFQTTQHVGPQGQPVGNRLELPVGAVQWLGDGGYVHYAAVRQALSPERDVMAQRFDRAGVLIGETRIDPQPSGDPSDPWVVEMRDGSHVVVWKSVDAGAHMHYQAQRFDSAATPLGHKFSIDTGDIEIAHDLMRFTALNELSDGGLVVTWQAPPGSMDTRLHLRQFDRDGDPVGGELLIPMPVGSTARDELNHEITALEDGNFMLAWSLRDSGTGDWRFVAQEVFDILLVTQNAGWTSGTQGDDWMVGTGSKDRIQGLAGDDRLDGGAGADQLAGGQGHDRYEVDSAKDKVVERAGEGVDTVYASVSYSLDQHVENLVLTGQSCINGQGNRLDNVITGNSASNRLSGGGGNDTLDGGAGADAFVLDVGPDPDNLMSVLHFSAAQDTIALSGKAFAGLTRGGPLNPAAFETGATASHAQTRVIFNPVGGDVFFDPDGSGDAEMVQVATLVDVAGMVTADDFVVF